MHNACIMVDLGAPTVSEIISIHLNSGLLSDLLTACRASLPSEACGIIYGEVKNNIAYPSTFKQIRNVADEPKRAFVFDPAEWVALCCEAEAHGYRIIGIFHSHPHGIGTPSRQDLLGWIPWGTYWIIHFSGTEEGLSIYRLSQDAEWMLLPVQQS